MAGFLARYRTLTYQGVKPADMNAELVEINGGPGIMFTGAGRVVATLTFDFNADGRIITVHNVANPDKLQAITAGTRRDVATR